MYQVLLTIYPGESLISDYLKKSLIDTIPQNMWIYVIISFVFIFLLYVLFTFILPSSKKNLEKLFKKYQDVRKSIEDIDELYNNKKLSYDEYVSLQWESAKEYERLIILLSKSPIYKQKLKSYNLVATSYQKIVDATIDEKKLTADEKNKQNKVNYLYNLLLPRAKYFSEDEIKLAIREEGFSRDIIIAVIQKIKESGVVFGSEVELKSNRIADFVNTLFASKIQNIDIDHEIIASNKKNIDEYWKNLSKKQATIKNKKYVVIDVREAVQSKNDKPVVAPVSNPVVTLSKDETKNTMTIRKKGGLIEAFKVLFSKKKTKPHSVSEINDIFKDIEKSLKERN